ncbi:MAG: hypothetical protein QGG40_04270, partial [Myxococcota bacterium]|nr:hypothetical protein [Myxococcota bacterium]
EDSAWAGILSENAELDLVDCTVSGTGSDVNLGGGYGIQVTDGSEEYPPTLWTDFSMQGCTVTESTLGAVLLRGHGNHSVADSLLEGGPGTEVVAGQWGYGDALTVVGGVYGTPEPWDESTGTGLLVEGTTLSDASGSGLFIDQAGATLSGNTWQDNELDVLWQGCDQGDGPQVEDQTLATELCPEFDYWWAWDDPGFGMLEEAEAVF